MEVADAAAIEREREARHRAEIAALVSRLVPRPRPSTDLLISLALPSPSEPWQTIKIGHSERNIDFWDERALAEACKKVEQPEKLELSRQQVDQVKAIRKAFLIASKDVEAELKQPELTEPRLFPRSYSEDVVLAPASATAGQDRGSPVDLEALHDVLQQSTAPECEVLSPTNEATSDGLAQLLDLTFTAPASAIEGLKRKRDTLRMYRKKSAIEVLLDEAKATEETTASAWASACRTQTASPPLFGRERSFARSSEASAPGMDALHLSPCSVGGPSSPVCKLDDEWSHEERLSSPTTSTTPGVFRPRLIESSPSAPPHTLPILNDADFPLFSRDSETVAFADQADTRTVLLAGLEEHVPSKIKRLGEAESSSEYEGEGKEDLESYLPAMPLTEDADMDGARLPFPLNLKVPVGLPVGSDRYDGDLPRLTEFSKAAVSPFSFGSLSSLRSLTIDLSWRAWDLSGVTESSRIVDDGFATLGTAESPRPFDRLSSELLSPIGSSPSFEHIGELETGIRARGAGREAKQPEPEDADCFIASASDNRRCNPSQADGDMDATSNIYVDDYEKADFLPDSTVFAPASAVSQTAATSIGRASAPGQPPDDSAAYQSNVPASPNTVATPEPRMAERLADRESGRPEHPPLPAGGLDIFLSLRNKPIGEPRQVQQKRNGVPCTKNQLHSASDGSTPSSGPPSAIPTIPSLDGRLLRFSASQQLATSLETTVKIVSFDTFTQMRTHLRHLSERRVHVVHRSNAEPTSPKPDLIVDPTTCAVHYRVADLLRTEASSTTGEATLLTRLEKLSAEFETVVLILEERDSYVGGTRVSSYNAPTLRALADLGDCLDRFDPAGEHVRVAVTQSPLDTADTIARIIRRRQSEVALRVPVLELWSERTWVTEDPSLDEIELVRNCHLNDLAAMAVLAVLSASDFMAMMPADRQAVFPAMLGQRCVDRLNQSPPHSQVASQVASPIVPQSTSPSPIGDFRQLSAIEHQADPSVDADASSDSFDWTEFLESLSQ